MIPLYTVDAFTERPFAVKPAAICLLDRLGPFWAPRLGKQELRAYQASARGGELRVRVRGTRVDLIGRAVTVLRGELADGAV